jgi:hypothetical protein
LDGHSRRDEARLRPAFCEGWLQRTGVQNAAEVCILYWLILQRIGGLLFFETLKLKCKFEPYNNEIEVETLHLNYVAMPPFSSQHFRNKLLTTVAIVTLASHSETKRKAAIFPLGQSHKEPRGFRPSSFSATSIAASMRHVFELPSTRRPKLSPR